MILKVVSTISDKKSPEIVTINFDMEKIYSIT